MFPDGVCVAVSVIVSCAPRRVRVYIDRMHWRCVNRSNRKPWDILTQAKARILEFVWAPHVNAGLRISAVKFMQRVILVQTRGINDPRVCGQSYFEVVCCSHGLAT